MNLSDEPRARDLVKFSDLDTTAQVVCFNWFLVGVMVGVALMGTVTVVVLA